MIEFKNVSVGLSQGRQSVPTSFVVQPGERVCICGPAASGKTKLLMAVMGLTPVVSGFVTIDGEPVDAGSGQYFRRTTSFAPQQMPEFDGKTGELLFRLFHLRSSVPMRLKRKAVLADWQLLGLESSLYDKPWSQLSNEEQRLVTLSGAALLQRPILLVDNPVQTQPVDVYLQQVAQKGTEIIYTCRENLLSATRLVNVGLPAETVPSAEQNV